MNDREMLELAAKAAGIGPLDFDYHEREGFGYFGPRLPMPQGVIMAAMYSYWNPLDDDGDAFRLAVKLDLDVMPSGAWVDSDKAALVRDAENIAAFEPHNGAPFAAVRRAIVRAAAEIGKALP